jgi:hypothetical protein
MANTNFTVHNGLTVGNFIAYASNGDIITSGNISTSGSGTINSANGFGGLNPSQIYSGSNNVTVGGSTVNIAISSSNVATINSTGLSLNGTVNNSGFGTIYANNLAQTNSAYVVADNNYVHFGSASATQLNWKVAGQTPAFIAANGTVIITGNTSLQSGGGGNLFVRNNTGSAVGMAITDATSFHVGTVTNSQFNLKQNNTTQAYIDTTGNVNILNSLFVTGNLQVSGAIVTNNTTNISTNNLDLVLANNQSTSSGVNGGGILLGSPTVVSWTYSSANNAWQSNVNILPVQNNTWNLGGSSNYWNTIYVGTVSASGAISGTTGTFSGAVAVNSSSGITTNQTTFPLVNATATTINFGGAATTINVGASGGVTFAPTGNAVSSLGSTSNYWNNVYAVNFLGTSTTAKYADLAERYTSDANYESGTVVDFGGEAEVTISNINGSPSVAGVVSTNPAYMMNSDADGLYIALVGRVPTKVTGPVRKGQMMVSNGDGTARAENNPKMGSVIGKALENFGDGVGVIEVVVGRL